MDFTTINLIAYMRQQQMLDKTTNDREAEPVIRPLLRQSGLLFVTIGEKLVQAGSETTGNSPSLESEAC